jgi:hypothetical protein
VNRLATPLRRVDPKYSPPGVMNGSKSEPSATTVGASILPSGVDRVAAKIS